MDLNDYSPQITVIIGKTLTFGHYPCPSITVHTVIQAMGAQMYSMQRHTDWNERLIKIHSPSLRSCFPPIYLYPNFPSLLLHRGVAMRLPVEQSRWDQRWQPLSSFDRTSMDNLSVSWIMLI